MKTFLLGLAAIAVSALIGMFMLADLDHIPDGHRAMVIGKYVLLAAVSVSVFASLYLIPRANRNLLSFLKAFVAFGLMASLGMCSNWQKRFNGPPHRVASDDGRISVEVPSDWSAQRPLPEGSTLMVSDWASTRSVNVVLGEEIGDMAPDQAIATMLEIVRDNAAGALGAPQASIACGTDCAAEVFSATARGKSFQVVSAVKIGCGRIMLVHSSFMSQLSKDIEADRRKAADIAATVTCTSR